MSVATVSPAKPKTPDNKPSEAVAPKRSIYTEKHISIFFILVCLLQTVFLGWMLHFLISLKIPDISAVASYNPSQATIIYDRHGQIVDRMFVEDRTVIPLTAMAPFLAKAFVAAEDGRFYEHPGLDFFSVLRAAINNFIDGAKSQGGSTITQQVIKSLLLTPEKTYIRKFKEAILAWRIDKLMTKDEILHIYLNQIYLGEGAYGVEAAAQTYFGKSSARLSLGESALLAGLPQAPSRYSLFDHLDKAVERQKYVLNRMAEDGYVGTEAAQLAYEAKILLNSRSQQATDDNAFYVEVVKKRARVILGVPLQTAGAKIYTHLDSRMQENGAVAVRQGVRASFARQTLSGKDVDTLLQGGLVCMETATGKVMAAVGGTSFSLSQFDRATQARRPAGSTFKPFVYAAALGQGWSSGSPIEDSPLSIAGKDGKVWSPHNYSGRYHGQTTLADALTHSLNTATVRLMQKIGYKEVHKIARSVGLGPNLPANLSLALGATEVSILQMTAAYVPFAGNGTYIEPSFMDKIVLADGTVILPEKGRKRRKVLNPGVLLQMRSMLRAVVTEGTGKAVAEVPGVGGGKTGTTDDYRDAWFIGYDNIYTAGVWVGNDGNEPMAKGESGGAAAAPIWRDFMMAMREQ
ncbi:MAG: PBP1A family penicillin-binding protein [Proteobacteria bacterium]|nr:PBP1A family penicillin-binding protein [Pseudomonadota bacterium]